VRAFYVVLLVLVCFWEANSQQPSTGSSALSWFHQLSAFSLSASPDGEWVAFGRSPAGTGSNDLTVVFNVYDVRSSRLIVLGTYNYGSLNFGPRPVWSPNSDFLAFYAVESETLRLKVWDRKLGRLLSGSVPVDKAGVAELQMPQWTPDSRFVLCFSKPKPARLYEEQEGNNYTARLRAELVGQRPAINGLTLLGSSSLSPMLQKEYGVEAGRTAGPSLVAERQIVAFDVRTGVPQILAQGAEFVQMQISDDGKVGLVAALNGSGDVLVYAMPLPGSQTGKQTGASSAEPGAPKRNDGAPLRLLFRSSSDTPFQNFNLSPSGRYVAYLIEGSGDIQVVDLQAGTSRNLTSNVPALVPDASNVELEKFAGRFDLPLYRGKFGINGADAPVWTKDGSALLMRRVIPQLSVRNPRRVELWRVSLADGGARRLTPDPTLSIFSWADCRDRSRVNCVVGPEGDVVALIQVQKASDYEAALAYAQIDATTGMVRKLRETSELAGSAFLAARTTGDAVSVEESSSNPQEVWWVSQNSIRSLKVLNPSPLPAIGAAQRLEWVSSSGERLFATLRFPTNMRDEEQLPVVLGVYPGRRGLENAQRFLSGRYEPLRSRTRIALLTPDMPVKFGSGHVCADLARYADEALDAAVATGRVDGRRAGVIGISYGGYSVNCIITHSTRFRAAVSEAGPSDLASTHALGGRGEWNVTKSWQWETPDRIVTESPVYHLDQVKTPVLFIAGKTDLNNALQEYEMYFGLQALKRPTALVSYDNAGHGDYDRFPDFWQRVAHWFEVYLNDR
jgi:hypothetical protein